jgi:DNA-binding CsgD family transcriptional regulator
LAPYAALVHAAWRGREADLTRLIEQTIPETVPRGEELVIATCQWVTALLHNGLGQYDRAFASGRRVLEPARKLDPTINLVLAEVIEAGARAGETEVANDALAQLADTTGASATDYGLGIEARCRALLSGPETAEPLYQEAIARLGRTPLRPELARANLLYGEWLRRESRRVEARAPLRVAAEEFTSMGITAFAQRARIELAATGARVRERRAEVRDDLTAQERQIAEMAGQGLSNPDIAARLFLSPRTVEWHLRKVFTKLGVRHRHELSAALAGPDSEGSAT